MVVCQWFIYSANGTWTKRAPWFTTLFIDVEPNVYDWSYSNIHKYIIFCVTWCQCYILKRVTTAITSYKDQDIFLSVFYYLWAWISKIETNENLKPIYVI